MTEIGVAGTCRLGECPVNNGADTCMLGDLVIHCDNFDPDTSSVSSDTTSAIMGDGNSSENDEAHRLAEAVSSEASTAQRTPSSEVRGASLDITPPLAEAEQRKRRESPLHAPTGPRRRVEFTETDTTPITSGVPLSSSEAIEVLCGERTQLVVLAGPPDCGKTTMLATWFELFCAGSVGTWNFAGSLTFNAFMRRCWYARAVSGGAHADTPRTIYGITRPFLHLRIAAAGEEPISLLIADLSGEYFRDLASGANLDEAAPIVRQAHRVVHLIDCAHWVDPLDRERARAAVTGRVRRMCETDVFGPQVRHVVVLARHDLCPPEERDSLLAFAQELAARRLDRAEVIPLAARPQDDTAPIGFPELLTALARTTRIYDAVDAERPLRSTMALLARAGARAQLAT